MVFFLKSKSRTVVHHYHEEREKEKKRDGNEASTSLTVWRKSLIFSCSGFTVIGSDGGLAYRVDNYTGRPDEIILMDGLRLLDNYWLVYDGEVGKYSNNSDDMMESSSNKEKLPIFCVRKSTNNYSMRQTKLDQVIAYVYCGVSEKRWMYTVEGSYAHRSCKILDDSRRVVGEIKKKQGMRGGASFGLEVFDLIVMPGFDSQFAMAFVLLLDQMFS
ncbi:hypothetical protein C2S52_008290 [Perilla frutescens var. hirtella]|nr:hypothetical protein C2S51_017976 [Perilla frutescens var. frutescens]KAH6783331.1 hypothetical protein C2S52_008290 [Perilla frutescens var. hirtella]